MGVENYQAVFVGVERDIELRFDPERQTFWATQAQLCGIFGVNISTVSRHIRNVFRDEEVEEESNLQKVQIAHSDRPVSFYSLDVILAVGYRTNSAQAIAFRKWATSILEQYLIDGVALNEKRLLELNKLVNVLSRSPSEILAGSAEIISYYLPGLQMLRDYDNGNMTSAPRTLSAARISIDEAREVIASVAKNFPAETMIGTERGDGLETIICAIDQRFENAELYPSVEEKAANILYLMVKDHPLADGNKRSAASLFVTFLAKNGLLYDESGNQVISNSALAAITLMIAMSMPREKDLMVSLVTRMLAETKAVSQERR